MNFNSTQEISREKLKHMEQSIGCDMEQFSSAGIG